MRWWQRLQTRLTAAWQRIREQDARQMVRDLRRTIGLVWRTSPRQASIIVTLSLLQAFVPAVSLWISKQLLDAVAEAIQTASGDVSTLLSLLILQVVVTALASLAGAFQNASRELLGDSLQNRISRDILGKASQLDLESFENPDTYDALQNAYNEVGSRPLGVLTQLITLGQALITLGSVGALMSQLGASVVPLVLLASVPSVWVSSQFGTASYRMLRRRAPDARVQNYLGRLLTLDNLVKEVRLFNVERYLLDRWQYYYLSFRKEFVGLIRRRTFWSTAASLFSTSMIAVATLTVLRRAARGQMTVGDFSLFVGGISQLQAQFDRLLNGLSSIYQHLLYMRNLFEFLELPSRDLNAGEIWQGEIHTITFENVGFRYPLADRDVLQDVSFEIHRGQSLALVGHNGAGKTTLVKLLTRLYEPTSGTILLNGQDATRYSPRSVQQAISSIFQDYGRYHLTVRENVSMSGLATAQDDPQGVINNDDAISKAIGQGGADSFVDDLPQQTETLLSRYFEGGVDLSGGQWQRLALSRLYFRDASVLVFDEPTAALDAEAEFAVIESLREQAASRIVLIISHRFSTVRLADTIVVLEAGKISERGSHAELMAEGGTYARMFSLQARGYRD
jgi:ATP-binding cassette subfamily B protein